MNRYRLVLLAFLLFPIFLAAQEMPFAVSARTRFSQSGMIGYTTVDSLTYFQVRFIQEFKAWKFKVGLDLDFLIDEDYHLRTDNWDHLVDIINKIYYIRFGERSDPYFLHVGGFPSLTMGNGLIMQNYSNMRLYPEMRNTGLMLAWRPKWPGKPNIELFSSDVVKNNVLSLNVRGKPLPDSTVKVLDQVLLGLSVVVDRNQYANLRFMTPDSLNHFISNLEAEPMAAIGLGYTLPLYETEAFTVGQYSEIAHIFGKGYGMILPGVYMNWNKFNVNLEYKIYSDEFLPGYFGKNYEEVRAVVDSTGIHTKEELLLGVNRARGFKGSVQAMFFDRVRARVAWQNIIGKGLTTGKSLWLNLWVDTSYKKWENFSISYSKTDAPRLSIGKLNEHNVDLGFSATYRLYKEKVYLIGKYSERYRDKNQDGYVSWKNEARRTFNIGVKYIHR